MMTAVEAAASKTELVTVATGSHVVTERLPKRHPQRREE